MRVEPHTIRGMAGVLLLGFGLALWLGFGAAPCLASAPGGGSPAVLSADSVVYDMGGKVIRASGHVRLSAPDPPVTILADDLALDLEKMEAVASGSVRLVRGSDEFSCARLVYGLADGSVAMDEPRATLSGEGVRGNLSAVGRSLTGNEQLYTVADVRVTGCDLPTPHYALTAREVRIEPGVKMVIKDARFVDSGLTVFWWPYLVISLQESNRFELPSVGYGATEGLYVKTAYDYYVSPSSRGAILLDYFERLGLGGGVEHTYSAGRLGNGEVDLYYVGVGGEGVGLSPTYVARWGHAFRVPSGPGAPAATGGMARAARPPNAEPRPLSLGFAVGVGNFGPGLGTVSDRVTDSGDSGDSGVGAGGWGDDAQAGTEAELFGLLWRPASDAGLDLGLDQGDEEQAAYGSVALWLGAGSGSGVAAASGGEAGAGASGVDGPEGRLWFSYRAAQAWMGPSPGCGESGKLGQMHSYDLRVRRGFDLGMPVLAEGYLSSVRQDMPGEVEDDYTNIRVGLTALPGWGRVTLTVDDYTPPKTPEPPAPGWPSEGGEDWEQWIYQWVPWQVEPSVAWRLVRAPEVGCTWEDAVGPVNLATTMTAGRYREFQPTLAGAPEEVADSKVEVSTTASAELDRPRSSLVVKATGVGSAYGGTPPRAWVSGLADMLVRPIDGMNLRVQVAGRACWGESPFIFDDAYPYARVVGTLRWSGGPVSASVSSGYDLLWDRPYDVAGRVTLRSGALRLEAVGRFDCSEMAMDSALLRATYAARDGARVRMGVSYDFDEQRAERLETDGRFKIRGRWTVEWAAAYDFETSSIARGAVGLTCDMHCRQVAVSYDAPNQRVWLEYRLNAFPSQGVGVGLGPEGLLLR